MIETLIKAHEDQFFFSPDFVSRMTDDLKKEYLQHLKDNRVPEDEQEEILGSLSPEAFTNRARLRIKEGLVVDALMEEFELPRPGTKEFQDLKTTFIDTFHGGSTKELQEEGRLSDALQETMICEELLKRVKIQREDGEDAGSNPIQVV